MKRTIAAAVAVLLVLTYLSGCHGAREQTSFVLPETFDDSKAYEITFWPLT